MVSDRCIDLVHFDTQSSSLGSNAGLSNTGISIRTTLEIITVIIFI